MSELVIPKELHRSLRKDDEEEVQRSAVALLEVLAGELDRPDLGGVSILDVGCGVKFTQAFLNRGLPLGSYTGVDVHEPVIAFLRSSVVDPRFRFHHVDFHNARYNPGGHKMTPASELPVEGPAYDLICGFSLFTHLDPDDFATMLTIMRRYAHEGSRLVFTAFLDVHTASGHGLIDQYTKALGYDVSTGEPYRDFAPDDVLRVALYSEDHVRSIIDRSPWTLLSVKDPTRHAQHLLTLAPA
jgi:SAM-dependent methyltransferase